MSSKNQRAAVGFTVALSFCAASIGAQSTSQDVTWRWTGGRTTPCNGIGVLGTFTIVVKATVDVPKFEGPTNFMILKNVSASAHSPGFRNGKAFLTLSADLVAVDDTKAQAKRTVVNFATPTEPLVGVARGIEESERLVLPVMRVVRGSAIKLTAAAGVTTNSGTCLFGTSTYNTPPLTEPPLLSPPAAPTGIRIVP
jgi:hypothetical protein